MGCAPSQDKGATGGVSSTSYTYDASQAAAAVLGGATCTFTSQVEVSIACKNLPKMDITSKSDPMAVLFLSSGYGYEDWKELARTDVLKNTSDPSFTKPLRVDYTFEQLQPMKVVVLDVDTSATRPEELKLGEQDFLGEARFLLSDLMTARSHTLTLALSGKPGGLARPAGCTVTLKAEELASVNAVVRLAFSGSGLDSKDTFSKSDPFLRISKLRESGDWVPVFKTEVIDNNLNPAWKPIEVDIRQLCNADEHRPLKLEVLDYDASGSHDLIGEAQSSLAQLRSLSDSPAPMLDLISPKKAKKHGYRNSGVVSVRGVAVTPRPSFLQYIAGGLQISFMVAIDFTGSNGDPRLPSSLHYVSPAPTHYEQAIMAVGRVLECYDTNKSFPVWGFGAGVPPSGAVSHCFQLGPQQEVQGVQGILAAYRQALPTLALSGPTLFAPIINAAAQVAQAAAESPRPLGYQVLLILTDGCIMDMAATKSAIVSASRLPLSLLIVGVGGADFSAMEELDADRKRLKAGAAEAARDIVQFVSLRDCHGGAEVLARQLLAEIPGQVVQYYCNIKGIPPPQSSWAPSAPPLPVGHQGLVG